MLIIDELHLRALPRSSAPATAAAPLDRDQLRALVRELLAEELNRSSRRQARG